MNSWPKSHGLTRAVVFCDSKAAIFDVDPNYPPVFSNTFDCKILLQSLSEQIVLQWIPRHCGVTGNEFSDHLTKKGASI
ncbi:hypothetical protein TNCV_522551 [Trichonephila clavipes]|nr:hypothetical protein TNCV_522551 [Trichonephila clavipes]